MTDRQKDDPKPEEQPDEVAPIHVGAGPTTDGEKTPQEKKVEKENEDVR